MRLVVPHDMGVDPEPVESATPAARELEPWEELPPPWRAWLIVQAWSPSVAHPEGSPQEQLHGHVLQAPELHSLPVSLTLPR